MATKIAVIPDDVWTPAYDADGQVRDGAEVAELTGLLDLSAWPKGMRVIVRRERPTRCPTTVHRPQSPATDRVRHQHHPRPATRPRVVARPPRPLRGPDPDHETNWPAESSTARLRPEPDLARHRATGLRADGVDADTRLRPRPGPTVGTETPAAADVLDRRPHHPPHPTQTRHPRAVGRHDHYQPTAPYPAASGSHSLPHTGSTIESPNPKALRPGRGTHERSRPIIAVTG